MGKATCAVETCDRVVVAKGLCDKHYRRERAHGDPLAGARKVKGAEQCSVETCSDPVSAKGLCVFHYSRRRHGRPLTATVEEMRAARRQQCAADDCDAWAISRGYCDKHYRRVLVHGDPTVRLTGGNPPQGPCRIEECDGKSIAWNLCSLHYHRWKRYGDPEHEPDGPRVQRHREDAGTHAVLVIIDTAGVEHRVLHDHQDTALLNQYPWYVSPFGYAVTTNGVTGEGVLVMARLLMGLERGDERVADHISGVRLDNRRSNLRVTTHVRNLQNQAIENGRGTSRFRGVHYDSTRQAWVARIKVDRKNRHIGRFSSEEEAAAAVARYREEHDIWPGY